MDGKYCRLVLFVRHVPDRLWHNGVCVNVNEHGVTSASTGGNGFVGSVPRRIVTLRDARIAAPAPSPFRPFDGSSAAISIPFRKPVQEAAPTSHPIGLQRKGHRRWLRRPSHEWFLAHSRNGGCGCHAVKARASGKCAQNGYGKEHKRYVRAESGRVATLNTAITLIYELLRSKRIGRELPHSAEEHNYARRGNR